MADLTIKDAERLSLLISNHARYTGSKRAAEILANWDRYRPLFRKVMPVEYRRARLRWQRRRPPRCRLLSRYGQGHRVSGNRARRSRLSTGRGTREAFARIRAAAPGKRDPRTGRAFYGLCRALLPRHQPHYWRPDRLPGQQPDPRLERPRLSRQLGRGRAQSPFDQ